MKAITNNGRTNRSSNGTAFSPQYFFGTITGENTKKLNGRVDSGDVKEVTTKEGKKYAESKYAENLVSRILYAGPYNWVKGKDGNSTLEYTQGFQKGSYDGEDYKWGWGTLACEDYMEMESSNAVMSSRSEKFTPFM